MTVPVPPRAYYLRKRLNLPALLLSWDSKGVQVPTGSSSRSTLEVNVTAWSNGLEVTGDGTGIVSHAGLGLLRRLADKTGLTRAVAGAAVAGWAGMTGAGCWPTSRARSRTVPGRSAISGCWLIRRRRSGRSRRCRRRTGRWRRSPGAAPRTAQKLTAAVNAARRYAWAQVVARHGTLPGVRVADKTLHGVTCIRLDATVTPAHSEKELAEANFKGFGHHPLIAYCDNTGGSRWRGCCARARRAATRPPITSSSWTRRSRRCRRRSAGT